MKALILAAPLCAFPLLLAARPAPPGASLGDVQWEPVLVYDVTGGTFTGPVHTNMVVFNNGTVSFARDEDFFGEDHVSVQDVGATAVAELGQALVDAGALTLNDAPGGADIPLTTVTILKGETTSPSRTFSWTFGTPAHQAVQQIITDFIDTHVETDPAE
ncbi:MAG: hypothetical protein AAF682_28275 [Planctomycetota bacterium]